MKDIDLIKNGRSQFVTLNTHLAFSASRFLRAKPLGHFDRLSAEKGWPRNKSGAGSRPG